MDVTGYLYYVAIKPFFFYSSALSFRGKSNCTKFILCFGLHEVLGILSCIRFLSLLFYSFSIVAQQLIHNKYLFAFLDTLSSPNFTSSSSGSWLEKYGSL